jgi:hypothetical protein
MGHIFISYSRNDLVYVQKLVNALRDQGFNPWVDLDELRTGTLWRERLYKQIKTCDAYLVILSRGSSRSHWVKEELILAMKSRKPLFPVMLEDLPGDADLLFGIQTVQYEDVKGGQPPSAAFFERLAKVSRRRKKSRVKESVDDLLELARQRKVDQAAEKASFYVSKVVAGAKDAFAVVTKVSSQAMKSVTNSKVVKTASSRSKSKTKTAKKNKK